MVGDMVDDAVNNNDAYYTNIQIIIYVSNKTKMNAFLHLDRSMHMNIL